MVFNVATHVRDDHTKNFSFMLDAGEWTLTPAYDVVFAPGPGAEHTMTVAGEGRDPSRAHCLEVAKTAGIRRAEALEAIDAVTDAVTRWPEFADQATCSRAVTRKIARALRPL
jgi:serine/threonine-protein kinase HipA